MHTLGHNPAVWAIVCIGLQDEFFDGREPNHEANAEELKMLLYNTQACDIIFNGLCDEEFNKISHLENAKVPNPSRNPSWMCSKVSLTSSK